jgi:molybdate transport system substrate-binding protein
MKCTRLIKNLALVCIAISAQFATARADITVFAAASLRGALDEIAALSSEPVTLSYAGSGTIARQVAAGAPADVIVLAHPRWMDWLVQQGVVLPETRFSAANNSLVVIAPKGAQPLQTPNEIMKQLGANRIAMGQHESVPAGIYARDWLVHIGLWGTLKDQLAEVENVRQALALVARRETTFGIVYRSDALAEPLVDIVYNIPAGSHDQITYPAAAITPEGNEFIALLATPKASLLFLEHGFTGPKAIP